MLDRQRGGREGKFWISFLSLLIKWAQNNKKCNDLLTNMPHNPAGKSGHVPENSRRIWHCEDKDEEWHASSNVQTAGFTLYHWCKI